jgi:membrane protease YdiL (CAAX protease family)
MNWIFLGPDGIRVGWRMLGAVWLWIVFSGILTVALVAIPAIRSWLYAQNLRIMTPSLLLFSEGIAATAAILAGLVIARVETRSFADYGLPLNWESAKRAAQGLLLGFAMVSALMGLIAAANGFSLGERALSTSEAVRFGLLYLLAFLILALFEEFSFRGYLQATLASRAGFWPAAIILSLLFGAIHLDNSGETSVGVFMAACFGLLAAYSLRRTGGIWLAIGMHASWDWGETYFYGVADSGQLARGHLLNSSFHGPAWLTGGPVGPEGSVFVFVVLILSAVGIHYMFRAEKKAS